MEARSTQLGVGDPIQPSGLGGRPDEGNILTTTYDKIFNWARRSAIWPMQFGLACCIGMGEEIRVLVQGRDLDSVALARLLPGLSYL